MAGVPSFSQHLNGARPIRSQPPSQRSTKQPYIPKQPQTTPYQTLTSTATQLNPHQKTNNQPSSADIKKNKPTRNTSNRCQPSERSIGQSQTHINQHQPTIYQHEESSQPLQEASSNNQPRHHPKPTAGPPTLSNNFKLKRHLPKSTNTPPKTIITTKLQPTSCNQ